ncbi:uncharacterized protein TNCV_386731 [Trichonephila clavipes]|nr:uncharacterized protein TNCV_386731 [Trichonephila clavipes]
MILNLTTNVIEQRRHNPQRSQSRSPSRRSPVRTRAHYSVASEQLRTQLRTLMFSEHNPILRTACGKVVDAFGRSMFRVSLNGVVQIFEFSVFQQCSHDLILGWDFFKATDDIIDCETGEIQIGEVSPNE